MALIEVGTVLYTAWLLIFTCNPSTANFDSFYAQCIDADYIGGQSYTYQPTSKVGNRYTPIMA